MEHNAEFARAEPPPIKDPLVAAAFRRKQKSSVTLPAILLMIAYAVGAAFYGILTLVTLFGAILALFAGPGTSNPPTKTANTSIREGVNLQQLAVFQNDPFGPAPEKKVDKKLDKKLDNKSGDKPLPAQSKSGSPSFGGRMIRLFLYALMLAINLGLCLGAYLTKRHESYPVAMITCIAAIFPFSILWCVSLPAGIWGLVALNARDVKLLFQR